MQKLQSRVLKTDLIFNRFNGEVIDKPDYIVVKTPNQPDYFWGNYLIMPGPPSKEDYPRWIAAIHSEIGPPEKCGFMAVTWDHTGPLLQDGLQPFLDAGFEPQRSEGLVAERLNSPLYINPELTLAPLQTNADWLATEDIHFDTQWPYGNAQQQKAFLKAQRKNARAMVDAGLGMRFGAKIAGRWVGDVGIYWHDGIGRFNNVSTHRDFRRRGVCQTLVHYAANYALQNQKLQSLVIEAAADSQAGRIYQSLGFKPVEKCMGLQWYNATNKINA